jgi:hypothetical protein
MPAKRIDPPEFSYPCGHVSSAQAIAMQYASLKVAKTGNACCLYKRL